MFNKISWLFSSLRMWLAHNLIAPHRDRDLWQKVSNLSCASLEQLRLNLLSDSKYLDPRHLARHGFKAYSQHTEDGLLDEIFRRIGVTNQFFVEFGVGDGLENNTAYRLALGWRGVWLDTLPKNLLEIRAGFAPLIAAGNLSACGGDGFRR